MPQIDELDSNSALVLRQRANFVSFNTITADYTLVASDWGKWIRANSSSDIIITVPPNASVSLPVGAAIPVVRRGTGEVTMAPGSGVTINSDGEDNVIPSQFKTVLLVQDAADSWLLQGIGATGSSSGGGGDVTAPTVTSAEATDANTIEVVFSEAVTGTIAGWSFDNGGALTVASRSGSGTNTWTFTITENMTSGDTITRTYNSGTGDAVDGSSNALASFTGSSVTNSIAGGGVDADAAAFIAAVEGGGHALSPTEEAKLDALVTDLKAGGIWTKLTLLYPLEGTTSGSQKWNLKNPLDTDGAFRGTFAGGSITHTENAISFGGDGNYINTHLQADALTANNSSMFFYSNSNTANAGGIDMGAIDATTNKRFQLTASYDGSAGAVFVAGDVASAAAGSNTDYSGFFTGSRTSSTSLKIYRNGVSIGSDATANAQDLPALTIDIGGVNHITTGHSVGTGRNISCPGVGLGLSDAEVLALYNAIDTYLS